MWLRACAPVPRRSPRCVAVCVSMSGVCLPCVSRLGRCAALCVLPGVFRECVAVSPRSPFRLPSRSRPRPRRLGALTVRVGTPPRRGFSAGHAYYSVNVRISRRASKCAGLFFQKIFSTPRAPSPSLRRCLRNVKNGGGRAGAERQAAGAAPPPRAAAKKMCAGAWRNGPECVPLPSESSKHYDNCFVSRAFSPCGWPANRPPRRRPARATENRLRRARS